MGDSNESLGRFRGSHEGYMRSMSILGGFKEGVSKVSEGFQLGFQLVSWIGLCVGHFKNKKKTLKRTF